MTSGDRGPMPLSTAVLRGTLLSQADQATASILLAILKILVRDSGLFSDAQKSLCGVPALPSCGQAVSGHLTPGV